MVSSRYKFRLWDKAIGEMSYDVCLGFIKAGLKEYWVCADTTCGQITYTGDKLKDIILMQCTGLKDKNNNLIYEGDICRNTKTNETVSVAWHGTMAGYVWKKRKHSYIFDFGELFRAFDKYEVIGNIYENKELLEVTND